jgi:hypothetical protein
MMNYLLEGTDPKFRSLLGKRVKFVCEGEVHVGILQFAGINKLLHNKFQVTVSRCPLWPVDPNTIKEVVNTQTIVKK